MLEIILKQIKYVSRSTTWLVALVYVSTFFVFNKWNDNSIIQFDVRIYYEYLPAALEHGDLTFSFLKHNPPQNASEYWLMSDPKTGAQYPKTTMGLALVYAPVYLIMHAWGALTGHSFAAFGLEDSFGIALSTLLFLIFGLYQARKLWLCWFDEKTVAIGLALVFLGTNLFHYTILAPGYGHVFSFALITFLIRLFLRFRNQASWHLSLFIGLISGLICLIRPTNAVIALFILPLLPINFGLQGFFNFLFNRWKFFLIILVGIFLAWTPQLLTWKIGTGSWWVYSYNDESFLFTSPHVLQGLFSFRNGWFPYSPVLLLIFPGLFFLYKQNNRLFWPTCLFIVLNSYVIYSWWCWWYGGSFGSRPQIDGLAISAIPLLACVSIFKNHKNFRFILWLGLPLIGLNVFQLRQSKNQVIHWDGMTWPAYKACFGQLHIPNNYPVLIKNPDYAGAKKGKEYPLNINKGYFDGLVTIPADAEFPLSYTENFTEIFQAGYSRLFVSVQYKNMGNTANDVFLVATIENENGETLKYQRWSLYNPNDPWFTYQFRKFEFIWEYDNLQNPTKLKIYLWNPNHQNLTLRNLRLTDY